MLNPGVDKATKLRQRFWPSRLNFGRVRFCQDAKPRFCPFCGGECLGCSGLVLSVFTNSNSLHQVSPSSHIFPPSYPCDPNGTLKWNRVEKTSCHPGQSLTSASASFVAHPCILAWELVGAVKKFDVFDGFQLQAMPRRRRARSLRSNGNGERQRNSSASPGTTGVPMC